MRTLVVKKGDPVDDRIITDRILALCEDNKELRAALEALWPVIDRWMPQKALAEMPRSDLDVFKQARAALEGKTTE